MPNNYFKFKQFTIYQDQCAMKVGTDGVLLGAWANCDYAHKILDIGTGTGLIALMLAQRSEACIDAIEIDEKACKQAADNALRSPWKDQIEVINESLQDWLKIENLKYDLIVSNPPYFQNSMYATDENRTNARHNSTLDLKYLIRAAQLFLDNEGILSVILPYLEGTMFILQAAEQGLFCVRQTNVLPKPGKEPKRLLLEFSKTKKPLVEQEIIIELNKRHQYSEAYKNLTRDFYLAF
ncbi:MAG: methyltransferase [Bacteroidales bacterium]|nr:methyltransferase [Bacteroidales bacterium]